MSENYWLKFAQQELRSDVKIAEKYTPFKDEYSWKRVTGRLEQSEIFSYEMRHPILLPGQSLIPKLILLDLHETLSHPGYNQVIGESRNKYWIINGRKLAKNIGYHCVDCRRWRRKQLDHLMSDIPNFRIQRECTPFENVAVFWSFLHQIRKKAKN